MLWSFFKFIKFWSKERNNWKYLNEKSDNSEGNTCDIKVFRSTIIQPFQFEPEQKKNTCNKSHEKETKHIHASAANLLHIRLVTQGLKPATLLKKRLWHRCFPVNFAKFLRNLFLQNTSSGCFSYKSVFYWNTC